jgi:UDP-3-O-[3-hydroxymyristoyl] glucosamine N-acyltransferase
MDNRFYNNLGPISLEEIANKIGAEIIPPTDHNKDMPVISGINSLADARNSELTFLINPKYENMLEDTEATAYIAGRDYHSKNLWLLKHANPYFAYSEALKLFYEPKVKHQNKIEKTAFVDPTAKLGKNVYIGHYTIIEEGAEIGDNTTISGHCFIGPGVKIGNNSRIDSNVTINFAIIGNDVVILPGARIGQDGFGFATEAGKHKKIFHIGRVIIEDDVEIGANTTIDRGCLKRYYNKIRREIGYIQYRLLIM